MQGAGAELGGPMREALLHVLRRWFCDDANSHGQPVQERTVSDSTHVSAVHVLTVLTSTWAHRSRAGEAISARGLETRLSVRGLQNAMTSSEERASAKAEGYRIERSLMDSWLLRVFFCTGPYLY